MLSKLFRKNKTNSYNQYFKANMNNIKNSWKEENPLQILKIYLLIFQRFYLPMVLSSQTK